MATRLTIEQHAEVEQNGDAPVQLIDPVTQKVYFLVSGEMFALLRSLLDESTPFDIRETYAAQEQALADVWDDPALDVYNDHPAIRPAP